MTKGIIQKVFMEYYLQYQETLREEQKNMPIREVLKDFGRLEQELIEEIRKLPHPAKTFREAKILQDYEDLVIGDTKE